MPDLASTIRWVPYAPDLFGNRALDAPFYFEMHGSMSKEQIAALKVALDRPIPLPDVLPAEATDDERRARQLVIFKATAHQTAELLGPYVRMGEEPLTMGGEPIATLERYLEFALVTFPDVAVFIEPGRFLQNLNMLGTRSDFFSGRLSGGFISTTGPNSGKAVGRAAAR